MPKKVQLFWRVSRDGKEFGFPIIRVTSHILIEGERVEYPRATAIVLPGGATQLTVSLKEGEDHTIVGPTQQFVQLTATLWMLYMAEMGDETFESLAMTGEVMSDGSSSDLFASIDKFLQEEGKKGHTDEAE